tara:strand:- start:187 stop:975 length:789 start_codon:yes stop_codon:yes gene_type:complete
MRLVTALIREAIESCQRSVRKIFVNGLRLPDSKFTNLNEVIKDGISLSYGFLSVKECKVLRDKIDSSIADQNVKVVVDDQGSDHRIFFADQLDPVFSEIYHNSFVRKLLKNYVGCENPQGMLLASRIDAVEGNIGSGGGWHRDSPFSHQFKAIFYLNSVGHDGGPFQYIKNSHSKISVLASYFNRALIPASTRFTEDEVAIYNNLSNSAISEIVANEGSVIFADTKGIHRGKPIVKGSRYALTCYFWVGDIPKHIDALRQIS